MRQGKTEAPEDCRIQIDPLFGCRLKTPLIASVEPLHPGFVAHAAGLPVFGYGVAPEDALEALKDGVENVFETGEFLDLDATTEALAADGLLVKPCHAAILSERLPSPPSVRSSSPSAPRHPYLSRPQGLQHTVGYDKGRR